MKNGKEKINPELEEIEEDELIKFVSVEDLLADEIENFSAERELFNAIYSDDEF
jgi:hypothetical protein